MQCQLIELSEIPAQSPVSVYGKREWLESVAAYSPFPLRILGLIDNGTLVGWLPWLNVKRGPWTRALPFYIDTTGGPYLLVPPNLPFAEQERWKRQAQKLLLEKLAELCEFASLKPKDSDPRALPLGDWTVSVRATARLDLTLAHYPWSTQAHKKLKRAQNKGLKFALCPQPARLEEALQNVTTRHNLGHTMLKMDAFCSLAMDLVSKGLLECCSVLDNQGLEVAYGFVSVDSLDQTIGNWFNLSTPEGLKLYASDFLFHELIQNYKGRFRWFDFCGTDSPSLIEFKEKWASETVYSFAYDYVRKPYMQHALNLFNKLRAPYA